MVSWLMEGCIALRGWGKTGDGALWCIEDVFVFSFLSTLWYDFFPDLGGLYITSCTKRELGRQSFTIRISLRFDACRICSLIVNRRLFISHTSDH